MDTKKFQGLRVAHVKERLTSYRLQLNDNSVIDIPRIELGGFVPQKGMFVRYRFYRGLILQRIEFDGKPVVNRTPAEIMNLLCRVDAKLEEDVRRQQSACENEDLVFDGLSEIMKQRIFQRCAGLRNCPLRNGRRSWPPGKRLSGKIPNSQPAVAAGRADGRH